MILRPGECVGPETKRERFFRGILISGPAEDRLHRRGNTLLSFLFPLTFFFFSLHPSPLASRRLPLAAFSRARRNQETTSRCLPLTVILSSEPTKFLLESFRERRVLMIDATLRYEFPASVTSYIKLAGSIYKRASCRRE